MGLYLFVIMDIYFLVLRTVASIKKCEKLFWSNHNKRLELLNFIL